MTQKIVTIQMTENADSFVELTSDLAGAPIGTQFENKATKLVFEGRPAGFEADDLSLSFVWYENDNATVGNIVGNVNIRQGNEYELPMQVTQGQVLEVFVGFLDADSHEEKSPTSIEFLFNPSIRTDFDTPINELPSVQVEMEKKIEFDQLKGNGIRIERTGSTGDILFTNLSAGGEPIGGGSVTIGEVTTQQIAYDQPPSVSVSAEATGEIDFLFSIPAGAPGADGADGAPGSSPALQDGKFREPGSTKDLPDLPAFADTAENTSYLVDDDAIDGQYDLYIHAAGGTDWQIVQNWAGVPGPKGDTGATGPAGATPAFTIGTTTTLSAGSPATATISGTSSNVVLNFGIPRGADGSGDGGGSASEPLKTPTVSVTNLMPNPVTFSGWAGSGTTIDNIENGILTVHNTNADTANPRITCAYAAYPTIVSGHLYFMSFNMRAKHINGDKTTVSFGNLGTAMNITPQAYTPPERWCTVSCVTTIASSIGLYSLYIAGHTYSAGEYTIDFTEPMLVDLTAAFGAGNEPDNNWCNNNMPFFEGTKELSAFGYTEKIMICIGDSNTSSAVYGYPNKLGVNAVNGGAPGVNMVQGGDWRAPYSAPAMADAIASGDFSAQVSGLSGITQRAAEATQNMNALNNLDLSNVQYISIAYGTNDFENGVPMGVDGVTDQTRTTFKGAIRYAINRLQAALPSTRLIFITPGWRTGSSTWGDIDPREQENSQGLLLEDYVNAIIEICGYYNITVVDLYHTSGCNQSNADAYLQTDGLHQTDLYQEITAKKLMAAVDAL